MNDAWWSHGEGLIERIIGTGLSGTGKFKGAVELASRARQRAGDNVEDAIDRIVKLHVRLAAAEGFCTGLPRMPATVITVPADVLIFYVLAGRMVGAIAHLRGYDVDDDDVHTTILLALPAGSATGTLKELGIESDTASPKKALGKLSKSTRREIDKKVGFRLIAKAGEKALIDLGRSVPFAGGPIGLALNVSNMRAIAACATSLLPFVPLESPDMALGITVPIG